MTQKTWSLTVGEDGEIEFPPDLLEEFGWTDETLLDMEVNEEDGTISLRQSDQCTS